MKLNKEQNQEELWLDFSEMLESDMLNCYNRLNRFFRRSNFIDQYNEKSEIAWTIFRKDDDPLDPNFDDTDYSSISPEAFYQMTGEYHGFQ